MSNDLMVFADDRRKDEILRRPLDAWHILVVDDEDDVHRVTRLVLKDVSFLGKPIKIHSAHSRSEAEAFLASHDDISIVLLDVVMEEEDAGLKLVRYIRETLGNTVICIILCTGYRARLLKPKWLSVRHQRLQMQNRADFRKTFTTVISPCGPGVI